MSSGPFVNFYQEVNISNLTFLEQLMLNLLYSVNFLVSVNGNWKNRVAQARNLGVILDSVFSHCVSHMAVPSLVFDFQNLSIIWEFPGGLVVRILGFHCCGPGFDPWLGNGDPASHAARQNKNKNKIHPESDHSSLLS